MDDFQFSGTERFKVIRQLGMGGMGVVYEALDHKNGDKVALKTLRNVDGEAIMLLKQEFRALGNLHHPNLIRLGELFESRGDWFFTMELIKGVDLMSWLRDADTSRIRDALTQLVTGLGALHDAGHIHRDIKPSNVLVTNGRVVLLDFGLVTRHDNDQMSWTDAAVVGTPNYMAPEQAASRPIGPEADFYSVGVILYEALCGRLPIEGRPLEVVMEKQRTVPPPASSFLDVPADLDQLANDLLRVDPQSRPTRGAIIRRLAAAPKNGDSGPIARDSNVSFTPSPRQTFVGRDAELEVLKASLAESDTGAPVTLLIEAESGMGKSALAERFVASLDRRDVIVLRGRCYERESVPYKAVDGVIDSLSRFMARLPDKEAAQLLPFHVSLLAEVFPVLRQVRVIVEQPRAPYVPDPQEQRRRVFAALRELFARLGARHPLVLLIDDLHWADDDSLALLDAVLRPPEAPCVFLVSTAWPRGDDEPPLSFGGNLRRMELGPLDEKEAMKLATALFANVRAKPSSDVVVQEIVKESAGHPMFVAELVRHTILRGESEGTVANVVRLDEVLAERIDALEPNERQLLELVAAAGRPLPLEVAGRALDMAPRTLVPLVGYLQSANLLRATGRTRRDSVEPYHDRTRRAVIAQASTRAPDLHRRLAVTLEATDAETQPMLVGEHWERAGEPARAAALYVRAGDRATEALAFDHAVKLYERCLTLDPALSTQLRTKLGDAYANAGRGREAADVYLALAKETKVTADRLELEQKATHQLLRGGHLDEGMVVLERLLTAVDIDLPKTPRHALAQLLWRRARVRVRGTKFKPKDPSQVTREALARIDMVWAAASGLAATDWIRGASFQTLNLLLSLQTGETFRARRALLVEACQVAASGPPSERTEALVLAATGGKELEDPYLRAWTLLARAYIAYFSGRWREAFDGAEQADAMFGANCKNVVWERDTCHALSHWAQVYLGSLKTLEQMLPERLQQAELTGNLYAVCALPASIVVLHWIARDDLAGGRAAIAKILERWSLHGYQIQHWNEMASNALMDLYEGNALGARKRVEEGWVPMSKSLLTQVQLIRFEVNELQARTAVAAALVSPRGERERYLKIADEYTKKMAKEDLDWTNAILTLRRAGIAQARGDRDLAVREYRAAVAACDRTALGLHAASARVRLGELVAGDEGAKLVEAGTAALSIEDIRSPAKMVALFAP